MPPRPFTTTRRRDNTLNDDIPFILDPLYSRPTSPVSSTSTSSPTSISSSLPRTNTIATAITATPIYTDSEGRIHDPTRRMFAVMTSTTSHDLAVLDKAAAREAAAKRRRLLLNEQKIRNQYHFHVAIVSSPPMNIPNKGVEDDDEDDDDLSILNLQPAKRPYTPTHPHKSFAHSHTTSFRSLDSTHSRPTSAYDYSPSVPSIVRPLYQPHSTTSRTSMYHMPSLFPFPSSSSPGNLPNYSPPDPDSPFRTMRKLEEDERAHFSDGLVVDDEDEDEEGDDRRLSGCAPSLFGLAKRRRSTSEDSAKGKEKKKEGQGNRTRIGVNEDGEEEILDPPTYLDRLHYRWHLVSLRIRIGLFRTKRRITSRVKRTRSSVSKYPPSPSDGIPPVLF